MSKFLVLGLPLGDVVRRSTVNPARAIDRDPMLGTLAVGAPADIAVLELIEGDTEFVDTGENTRQGNQLLRPVSTIRADMPFGQPYGSPFSRG